MEILVIGFIRGSLYSLVVIGFVLVFSVGGILNLSHGIFYMMGAYFTYIFYTYLFNSSGEVNLIFSMLLAILAVVLFALGIYRFVYKKAIHSAGTLAESINTIMVLALIINLFTSEMMSLLFGVSSSSVPALVDGSMEILGVRAIRQELLLIPVTAAIFLGLWFFLNHTRIGRSVSAVAQNKTAAILMGVSTEMSIMVTIGLSAALAALAGTLISSVHAVVPHMWLFPLIKSFCIAIVGGLGSVLGAIMGSFLVGYAEVLTSFIISEQYADFVSLFILAIILMVKPEGLMGAKRD